MENVIQPGTSAIRPEMAENSAAWTFNQANVARTSRISNSTLSPVAKAFIEAKLLNNRTKISPTLAVKFWHHHQHEKCLDSINATNFARYCHLNPTSFTTLFNQYKKILRESEELLTDSALQWLNQLQVTRPIKVRAMTKLFIENLPQLNSLKINATQFSRHFGIKPATLHLNLALYSDKKKNAQCRGETSLGKFYLQVKPLTPGELEWFSVIQNQRSKITAIQVAKCCLPHLNEIKSRTLLVNIARHFNLAESSLLGIINEYKRNQRELAVKLSPAARHWLQQLQALKPIAINAAAKYFLQCKATVDKLGINRAHFADRLGLNFMSFNRAVTAQNSKARSQHQGANTPSATVTQPAPPLPVKLEPLSDSDGEAELWFKPRLFNPVSTLLWPDDEEIALRHAEGPLRERLNDIDLLTLRITDAAVFPALLKNPALRTAANQRLQRLVSAARKGELEALIQSENYYKLVIDIQHPRQRTGLYAARFIPKGFLLGLYPGVLYSRRSQFKQAARNADSSFSHFAFENNYRRTETLSGSLKRKPAEPNHFIGGHLQTSPLVFINTGEMAPDGSVVYSAKNNLAAVMAGEEIIALVTTRAVQPDEELLLDFGYLYRFSEHQPIKLEPLDNWPRLNWLADNIHTPDIWNEPVNTIMPQLIAQSDLFRQRDACLLITNEQGKLLTAIDSASGEQLAPQQALISARRLVVIQHQGGNHYDCWWARQGNVSFSLMANSTDYQIARHRGNHLQQIPASDFSMSEATAVALLTRAENDISPRLAAIHGQQLREQIADFIRHIPVSLRDELENQLPQQ